MNNIRDIDFVTLANEVRAKNVSSGPKMKKYVELLPHCIPYLAKVPVLSNKPTECLTKLKTMDTVMVNDEPYSAKQLMGLIIYLTEMNRSEIIMDMAKTPRYGSLTPLLMFALKEARQIPYSYWDKKDPMIRYFLTSRTLYTALIEIGASKIDNILDLRNTYIAKGARGSATFQVTGFNKEADIKGCPAFVRHMLFQTWIANEDMRDEETMILDPVNWSNIPKLYVTTENACDKFENEIFGKRGQPIATKEEKKYMPDLEF